MEADILVKPISRYDVVYIPLSAFRESTLCRLPYPNHPHGCPNFNRKESCPPNAKCFSKLVSFPLFLIGVRFDLEKHVEKMRIKHPRWSERQLTCLLYWQNRVDKLLREECNKIVSKHPDYVAVYKPEANGVNVFATCRNLDIILERNPKKYVWKIAIIGVSNDKM